MKRSVQFKSGIITLILCLGISSSRGQTIQDAYSLMNRNQLDSAIAVARKLIDLGRTVPQGHEVVGRSLFRKGMYDDAIGHLQKVGSFADVPLSSRALSLHDLAICYFAKGDYNSARGKLSESLNTKTTKNLLVEIGNSKVLLGFDEIYKSWVTKESNHFNFHFQDTTSIANLSSYIKRKEKAFEHINSFFRVSLPKKIDYFVWSNKADAENSLSRPLAFTRSGIAVTHTSSGHTIGHEMTHSISYFTAKPRRSSRLINEGVCVYFAEPGRDNLTILNKAKQRGYSVTDVWVRGKLFGDDVIYPLGGELVKRLIETFGREKFIDLLSDQSYENAKSLYGDKLEILLTKLQNDLPK